MSIRSGELVCLLGPSGCGKTTALRVLAGFEKPDSGSVLVEGRDISADPPERRRFGMVFQDYSLFPNLSARQNIEFGLKVQKRPPAERREIIDRMLAVTALGDHADKFPHQMSGGQKQRVALARAIATSPRVLLLDEPLSALDAKVRESLRDEIRRLQLEIGVTTVFVTHDQHEALAISDRVGVMSNGRLEQLAPPRELYERPANAFVASFIGTVNKVPAVGAADGRWLVLGRRVPAERFAAQAEVDLAAVRPEQLAVEHLDGGSTVIAAVSFLGAITRVTLTQDSGDTLIADVISADAVDLAPGMSVRVRLRDDVTSVVLIGGA
ncbi:MAG: ABC transporter ATP-binding protein [bacterium]|nr:ABC transporter ATP-binding protein [bacterium]